MTDSPADPGTRDPVDPSREYRDLVAGRGILDLSSHPELRLSGPDRIRFLSGLVTCRVVDRAVGTATYGFFTDVKGRILADAWFSFREDAVHVELPPERGEEIRDHVGKYRIADRVELDLEHPARWALPGEDGAGVGLEPLPDLQGRPESIGGIAAWVERRPVLGIRSLVITGDPERSEDLFAVLGEGRRPCGPDALETARIEAGHPRFGRDFGSENFPQETGLAGDAVTYDKGCYLGQEVVARIHYRGGVNRHLRGLEIEGDGLPSPDSEILLEDRPLGRLGSVARSPLFGKVLGLAILHKRGAGAGTVVEIGEKRMRARVVELPWEGA